MQPGFQIAERPLGPETRPYVVAEMSGNHNCSLERALQIVEAAAACGVDAVKIQTFTPDTMTLDIRDGDFMIRDPKSLWNGRSLYELYEQAQTPREWHEPIFRRCGELGIAGFSTPFDETAVDFLESLGVPAYKIASFENTDTALIRKVAATGKPVLISTGMASIAELDETVQVARDAGCRSLMLLKCTSSYPSSPEHSNVRSIPYLKSLFGCEVGLSDHTGGVGAAIASVACGATLIEKHFTLRRADGGLDAAFSLEPDEMHALVVESERAWQSLGSVSFGITEGDRKSLIFRRSLFIVQDIQPGEVVSSANMRSIRPGSGLAPHYRDKIIGRRAKHFIKKGTPVSWDLFE